MSNLRMVIEATDPDGKIATACLKFADGGKFEDLESVIREFVPQNVPLA